MNPDVDPFQELAELFLTEPDEASVPEANGHTRPGDSGGPDEPSTRPVEAELIVVGSLPVRAALWLVPYADAVAKEVGPTGLVRLDGETPTLQVLRGGPAFTMQRWASLVEAIADLGSTVRRWIVRPALELTPGDLAAAGCGRITVLSGANEGAIVDAYRRVKLLIEAVGASGSNRPEVGLAVVGAERPRAEFVQQQVNRTTGNFLGLEVPLVACVQRMEATIQTTDRLAFSGEPKPPLRSVLRWIRDAAIPPEPPVAVGMPSPFVETEEAEPSGVAKLGPKPGVAVEPKELVAVQEPDYEGAPVPLATYIEGLTPLDVRCPSHERLEFGIDAKGALHVIAPHDHMRELHVVEAWARAHRELIGRACPDHLVNAAAKTVCHVISREPVAVADLHGSDLHLHVLAPVVVDGKQGWYAAPLTAH